MTKLRRQSLVAGQYIVHNFSHSPALRLAMRANCGPYVCTRRDASTSDGISFYYDSDFAPSLRMSFVHEFRESIQHKGWYTDDEGHGDTIVGIVARLPGGRGYLAGWSMGDGMVATLDTSTVYALDDEAGVAYAADRCAELAAEGEREHYRVSVMYSEIDELRDTIELARDDFASLADELRAIKVSVEAYPSIKLTMCERLREYRNRVLKSVTRINELKADIALYE